MKKRLPLDFVKNFRPEVNQNIKFIKPSIDGSYVMKFEDIDQDSNFFFEINQYNPQHGYLVVYKPASHKSVEVCRSWMQIEEADKKFKEWSSIIAEYDQIDTIFDDPIIKGFQEDYFAEFEILDDENSDRPLKSHQILQLDQHLENIESSIENFRTQENSELIDEVKNESAALRNSLSTKSRKSVLKSLTMIWAKLSKAGTPLIKEFLNEAKKRGVIEIVKQGYILLSENL